MSSSTTTPQRPAGCFTPEYTTTVASDNTETLRASFVADVSTLPRSQRSLEPALVAAWALCLARSFETKTASFTIGAPGTRFTFAVDGSWTVSSLLETISAQLAGAADASRATTSLSPAADETSTHLTSALTVIAAAAAPAPAPTAVDCTLTAATTPTAATVTLDFAARVDAQTARLLSSRYGFLLEQVLHGDRARAVAALDGVSAEDWRAIARATPAGPRPAQETLLHMFDRMVGCAPDAVAVEAWDGSFTYAELEAASRAVAAAVAARLRAGADEETIVPVCFEKSRWQMAAIYGVLRAGAAYVALDPAYPRARIEAILGVVAAPLVLVSAAQERVFAGLGGAPKSVLVVGEELVSASDAGRAELPYPAMSAPVAVIFTSGSTGVPKGVVLTHENLATHIREEIPRFALGKHTRFLQFATLTFDASFLEIFSPLCVGGTTCILHEKDRLNDLDGAINRLSANISFLTTTVASLLDPARVPTLQTLIVGGEPITDNVINAWSGRNLHAIYGPSETTICCQVYFNMYAGMKANNLGRPFCGQTFIVDPEDHNRLVPFGTVGELVVSGPILGHGYLKDPTRTAAAWIDRPAWTAGGAQLEGVPARIYKTGDLVRYERDGTILYGGRKDTQTKLRGQRLELGEIETHLLKHPNVLQCAVFHPKAGPAKHRIAALIRFAAPVSSVNSDSGFGSEASSDDGKSSEDLAVVAEQGCDAFWETVQSMEEHLAALVPQYMVPNVWIGVQKFPLTFSGKIDRVGITRWMEELPSALYHRLVRVETASAAVEPSPSTSPNAELECKLRAIWSEALNFPVERIPLDAPFFQLGGDSITAMQVVSRCSQTGIPCTVQQVLTHKTITRLAADIAATGGVVAQKRVIEDNLQLNTPFALSPIQKMFYKLQPEGVNHHNQGFLLRLTKRVEPDVITRCINIIVEAHAMLRARYRRDGKEWVQFITDEIESSYSFEQHRITALEDVRGIVERRQRVFDIQHGPMFTADLFEGLSQQVLFINAQHLVMDLVSWRIILQDMEDLLQSEGSIRLTSTLSFQTWSKLQLENARESRIEDILPFEYPKQLDLRQYWGLDVKNFWKDNKETVFHLTPQLTELFLRDANEPFDTAPMDLLLTALAASFLDTFTDRPNLVVHPEGHGRETWDASIDLSRTVGWFTVIYPLLMTREASPFKLLEHAKEIRKKMPGGGRPFFAAWHHSQHHQEDADDWVSPIEILFNYQGGFQQLHRKSAIMQRITELDVEDTMNSPDLHRYALFEVEAAIEGDRLGVHLIYNKHIKREAEVLRWMQNWEKSLTSLLEELAAQVVHQEACEMTEQEKTMAGLWRAALSLEEDAGLSREQNFLNMGADNFDAMKLVSLARNEGWHLELETILEKPKLKDMAANLRPLAKDAVEFGVPTKPFELLGDENAIASAKEIFIEKHGYPEENIEDIYPCAPLQEALVALSLMNPGAYTTDHVYDVPADLDVTRFKLAWAAVVQAHPVLRTQFALGDNSKILQVVLKDQPLDWYQDEQQDVLVFKYKSPLLRYGLFDMGTPKAKFIWTIHHTLADGWAFELVIADVTSAYRHGAGVILQTPRTPFSCFIHYIQNVNMQESLEFWRKNLDGYVPTEFPPVKSTSKEHEITDTKTLTRTVRLAIGATGFTGATLLRAAWALLLSRVSHTDDVVFGATVTGRMVPIKGIETMVGPTIQTLPTRVQVDHAMSVADFLENIQKGYIETIPHEHVGLQNISRLGEAAKAACAARTMLVVQPPAKSDEGELMSNHEAILDANYPLAMNCWQQQNNAVKVQLQYDCTQLDDSTAGRILSQYECLLEDITDSLAHSATSRKLEQLSSFSPEDARQLQEFNAHVPVVESDPASWGSDTLHAQIERNARLNPDAPAVHGHDGQLSYLELNMLSSRLASYLKSKLVGPETMVPVVFKKSVWYNVAVLAVWKAGACHVPIDPTQPRERLAQIVETISTRAVVALSSAEQADFTRELTHLQTIAVSREAILGLHAPNPPSPQPPTKPTDAAYVIFTSGSTGKPKGVVVEHGALYATAKAQVAGSRLTPDDRCLAFCSYIWDVHVLENFISLFAGACVCVPSDAERTDSLVEAMRKYDVTWATSTPTVCEMIDPAQLPKLRCLQVGGEAMTPRLIEYLSSHVLLVNAYGPTEAAVTSHLNVGMTAGSSPKTIGFPVGSQSWIVDANDHNRILPVGSVGELVLSGPCLARGYLDREAETTAAFVSAPAWAQKFPGMQIKRIYKTGDLAKFNDDGSLEFFGRKDAQVKVNGIRIELGEVEHNIATLSAHECAVETSASQGSQKVLVAFVKWLDGEGDWEAFKTATEEAMKERLPGYMVPALWVPMEKLPVQTGSDKIDRKKLRAFFDGMSKAEIQKFACQAGHKKRVVNPPANQNEKSLRDLWALILEMRPEEIGRDDHFFRLQGDSVSAIRLVSEARRNGFAITTKMIFQNPVLADMAAVLELVEGEVDEQSLVAPFSLIKEDVIEVALEDAAAQCGVDKEEIEDLMPCSPMQQGLIASSFAERGTYVVNHVSSLPKDLDLERFKEAWEKALAANAILRTRIIQSPCCNDDFLQVVMKDTKIPWDIVPRDEWDAYLQRIIDQKHYSGSRLITFGLTDDRFVLNVHHALYDAGSLIGVFEHFRQGYLGQELTPRAPYRNFVKFITELDPSESENLWKRELDGASGANFPAPENQHAPEQEPEARLIHHKIDLGQAYSGIYTMPTMLRAAWALVISRHTRKEDITYRETLSGKTAPVVGIDNMAGPTICTVPFRVQFNDDLTVGTFLDNVNSYATRIMGHEHIGIANISHLSPDCQAACQFKSLLVIQPSDAAEEHIGFGIEKVSADMTQNIPLILELVLLGDAIKMTARYDENIISESQMKCVLGHIENAFKRLVVADDDMKVNDISLFGAIDEAWISQLDNPTPDPLDEGYMAMFMRQVAETPDREAICAHDGSFTYAELAFAVDALASHFMDAGISNGTTIALCFNKSKWVIVFMLATIRAGATYVSLDPGSPAARINLILDSCQPHYVFSIPEKLSLFEGMPFRVHPIHFEYMWPFVQTVVVNRDRFTESRDSPVYMIFTSGSTGTPKGVVIPNMALADFSQRYKEAADITAETRTLQFSAYTFDAAVIEIFVPLVVGGCVCIPSDDDRTGDLAGVMERMRVTWCLLLPSVAVVLEPQDVPTLKTILLAGEGPTLNDCARWYSKDVRGGYGPSECTCLSLITQPGQLNSGGSPANLGYQANCSVWIANIHDRNKLAGVGEVGEIVISGYNLALGYLNDKKKTDASFYNAPWLEGRSTTRCYLSGDLGKYASDGTIIFSGRKDNQVKLRGFRIEIGEIEYHLVQQEAISRGVVILSNKGEHRQKLVAVFSLAGSDKKTEEGEEFKFVVRKDAQKQIEQFKQNLQGKIPNYMVPTMWICLEKVPVTIIGKVDRRAISAWLETYREEGEEGEELVEEEEVDEDDTPLRRKLRKIWADILDRPENKIKPDASFFRLGGDSISAIRLVSRFKRENINITSKQIKKLKTIAAIEAAIIEAGGVVEEEVVAKEISYEPFELSPIQKMHFDLTTKGHDGFSQTTLLKVNGRRLSEEEVAGAAEALATHHTILRTSYRRDNKGSWKQQIERTAKNAFKLSSHDGKDLESLRSVAAEAQKGFDLQNGHVLNLCLFNIGTEQYLLVSAHHLVIDFVSWKIVVTDLETLITSAGKEQLAPVFVPYNEWVDAVNKHAATLPPAPAGIHELDMDVMEYWGIDRAEHNVYSRVVEQTFTLTRAQTDTITAFAGEHDVDFLTVLLSTLAASFWKTFPEREHMGLFLESHGRDTWTSSLDLSRTVGWFTTFFPLFSAGELRKKRAGLDQFIQHFKGLRDDLEDPHAYLATRYGPSWRRDAPAAPLEILFNHFGVMDNAMSAATGLFSMDMSVDLTVIPGDMPRTGLFEITTSVSEGKLGAVFHYHEDMDNVERIHAWVKSWEAGLVGLGDVEKKEKKTVARVRGVKGGSFRLLPREEKDMQTLLESALPEIGVAKEDVEDIYPCSPMQVGLILAQMRNPEEYNVDIVWNVTAASGSVDTARLREAWIKTMRRHSLLRTIFVEDPAGIDSFLQVVLKADAAMPIQEEGKMVHPMGGKLPHRLTVKDATADKPVRIVFQCSHAIYDAYSNGVLLKDLIAAYDGTISASPAPGYGLFIEYLKNNNSEKSDKQFWSKYLADAEITHFPALANAKAEKDLGVLNWDISNGEDIVRFCRDHDTTPALFFKFVWGLVLRLYTGNDSVVFGSLVDGRDAEFQGVDGIVGPLINTIICKIGLQGEKQVRKALEELQEAADDGSEHQRASLAQVESWAGFKGMSSFNTVMSFYMEDVHQAKEEMGSLRLEHVDGEDKSDYPVVLKVAKKGSEFGVQVDYHTAHLEEKQVQEVKTIMNAMIEKVVRNPAATVNEIQKADDAILAAAQSCCGVVHPADKNRLVPSGCRGDLVLKVPGSENVLPTGQTARYDASRIVADLRPAEEFVRVRGFEIDLKKVERAFEMVKEEKVKQFVAVPVHVLREVAKLAVYVCFAAEAPNGAEWEEMSNVLRRTAKANFPAGYQHLVDVDQLVPLGGCKQEVNRRSVLGLITGQLLNNSLSINTEAKVEKAAPVVERNGSNVETALKETVARILGMPEKKVTMHTNFFEVGGDSLTAMQLVGQMKKQHFKLAHGDILRFPVLETMAAHITDLKPETRQQLKPVVEESADIKPFSLIKSTPESLKQLAHPVEDAYPTTFMQQWSYQQAMSPTRRSLAHFIWDIPGALDQGRLRNALNVLVQRNEILRTVFVEDGSIQAVLREDFVPDVSFDSVTNIESATDSYIEREGALKQFGEVVVRFKVFSNASNDKHRLIMRITHAQFDGLSMMPLMEEIHNAYTAPSTSLPRKPKFVNFIKASADIVTPTASNYWKTMLSGTNGMTSVQAVAPGGESKMSEFIYVAPNLANSSFRTHNATFNTAIKSAWAHVLAKHTGTADVVFANLVSARTADVKDLDSMIGCAVNFLPVRVNTANTTPLASLRSVQQQHAESMPYECMDYSAIAAAANWSRPALRSIVQHHALQDVDATDSGIGAPGARWGFFQRQPVLGCVEAWIVSVERAHGMELVVGFDESILPAPLARTLAVDLGTTLEHMAGVSGGHLKPDDRTEELPDETPSAASAAACRSAGTSASRNGRREAVVVEEWMEKVESLKKTGSVDAGNAGMRMMMMLLVLVAAVCYSRLY